MTTLHISEPEDDLALEEEIAPPRGYQMFLARLRVRARIVARDRGLTAFAAMAEHACYAELYEQLFRHDYGTYVAALEEIYDDQHVPSPGLGDLFHLVHQLPSPDPVARQASAQAAAAALHGRLARSPIPRSAFNPQTGFLETKRQLSEAFSLAASVQQDALLVHISEFLVNIATARLAEVVNTLASGDARFSDTRLFVRLLNQLKRIVRLGAADRLLSQHGGAGDGLALLNLMGAGLAPVVLPGGRIGVVDIH